MLNQEAGIAWCRDAEAEGRPREQTHKPRYGEATTWGGVTEVEIRMANSHINGADCTMTETRALQKSLAGGTHGFCKSIENFILSKSSESFKNIFLSSNWSMKTEEEWERFSIAYRTTQYHRTTNRGRGCLMGFLINSNSSKFLSTVAEVAY